jgi:fibronectin type 3 domain-containing protein
LKNVTRPLLLAALLLCPALAFAQSHSATLSWTPVTQSNGITIANWNVLRGNATDGPYTQIAKFPVAVTSYTDTSVSSGQNYFYVVLAMDTTGTASVNSMEAEAIIPNSAPPLAVSTTSLPPATTGTNYSATITASGGTSPYTWSGTGVDGLTFSATGVLCGTPSQAGTFTQSVTVKDSAGKTASASLTLTLASTSGGGTSIVLIQHRSKDASATSSSTLAFASNNTVGNWIAVSIRAGTTNETFTVTDTNRNTYRKAIQFRLTVDPDTLAIFYAENIAGGANTVTVSDNTSATLRFAILEYSGVATSGSLDGVAVTQGNSASPNSSSITTTANGDLLLGAIMTADPEAYTAGSGYRIEESVPAEPGTKLITEDQAQAAAGTAAASASLRTANPWAAGIAAFKPAGSGAGTAPTI